MSGKVFTHKHVVYLNETNAMGGVVYFANFVKWQGMVREEFFMRAFPMWEDVMKLVMAGSANMITVEEHSKFIRHTFFGDTVIIKLQTANLKKCSFDLIFKMYRNNEDELIYEGWQRLTFDDYKGNFIPIPEPFRETIMEYQAPEGEYKRSSMRSERMKTHLPTTREV